MLDILKDNYGLVLALVSANLIIGFNYFFKHYNPLYPMNLKDSMDEYKRWKWRNFCISFTHSVITGIGSLYNVSYKPSLLVEVIDEYLESAYLLTSVSFGYFIYDLIEMLTHLKYKGNKELVIHHIMILMCFSLTVIQHKYCGYSSIALLIELSNVFLHFRQLLLISNTSKLSQIYKINCYTNIALFIVVRGLALVWLWITLLWVLPRVPTIPKMIAFTTLTGICIMTCILFRRVYESDFSPKSKHRLLAKEAANGESTGAQTNGNNQSNNGLSSNPSNDKSIYSKLS